MVPVITVELFVYFLQQQHCVNLTEFEEFYQISRNMDIITRVNH